MTRWLCTLILLTGCAAKHKHIDYVVPVNCIIGGTVTSECKQISESAAVCDGMVIKFACVKVKEQK